MINATGDFILPVDKPEGPTSHDVVRAVRKAVADRRVGHTGTLDPFASGLLFVCVGRATRLAEYLSAQDKSYDAVALLGVTEAPGGSDNRSCSSRAAALVSGRATDDSSTVFVIEFAVAISFARQRIIARASKVGFGSFNCATRS